MTRTKASVKQNEDLAIKLWANNITASQVVPYLKERSYTINNIYFNASAVAYCLAGIERVCTGLSTGRLKFTKAKGVQIQKS